ncbi:MAG: PhzF family phenazine biosynthesis protein [Xanthobacteraceae bacterium]
MRRRFVTLDVFTEKRFAGNPLAVVLEPDGLDTAAMQQIAREFNLSETVFVQPPENNAHRAKLRIFTPASELPFAGHPTVGTAVLLGRIDGGTQPREFVLELGIGPVRCQVTPSGAGAGHAVFDLPKLPQDIGAPASVEDIAAALGIAVSDIGFGGMRPARWSAGAPYTLLPLRDLATVGRCAINSAAWKKAFGFDVHAAVYMFCRQTAQPGHAFHTRMFAPSAGIDEDPATGSAAAAIAGYIAKFDKLGDGNHPLVIEQGYEMGRPSLIELTLKIAGGKLTGASIGGGAIVVTEGTIEA